MMPPIDWTALAAPFPADDIEWRLQQAGEKKNGGGIWGMALAYVTNRAIMSRLDAVVGAGRWKNEFREAPGGGILCGIAIYVNETLGWVTKYDGADQTDIEATKGGLSNAMKRAAVQWGIGRYLYNLDAGWVDPDEDGQYTGKTKQGTFFKWNAPKLPDWALPENERSKAQRGAPVREAVVEEVAEVPNPLVPFIKANGASIADDATIIIKRKAVPLREFIKEQWGEIRQDAALLARVAQAVSEATGVALPS